jgi:phosphoenolpyruvate carboxylase
MTSSADELLRIKEYYKSHIIGKKDHLTHDLKISDWVGDFKPDDINVIPLIETKESMLDANKLVREYVEKAKIEEYQRVWLARSDPALNYGYLPAVLINKIALQRLHALEEEISVDLPPIIGCGSVPFRGNFRPDKMNNCMDAYPSVQTFTLQSAFKYDFPEDKVRDAVSTLENSSRKSPLFIDEKKSLGLIEKVSSEYQKQIIPLAPMINNLATFVPGRRKRKMHIGLFGYSRQNAGVTLPRAIKFCAALYSLGLPPEIFGLNALDEKEIDFVKDTNKGFEEDMKDALRYYNEENLKVLPVEQRAVYEKTASRFDFVTDESHKKVTSIIYDDFRNNRQTLTENIERAAAIRSFLG